MHLELGAVDQLAPVRLQVPAGHQETLQGSVLRATDQGHVTAGLGAAGGLTLLRVGHIRRAPQFGLGGLQVQAPVLPTVPVTAQSQTGAEQEPEEPQTGSDHFHG